MTGHEPGTRPGGAVNELRARGACVIHNLLCIDNRDAQEFGSREDSSTTLVCPSL